MASLRLTFPEKDQPTVIALTGARLTIGRLPFNTIQIIDRTVSGFHAELISEHGHYRLHDRGSSNGTYVNGQKVSDYHLNEACTISFGTVEVQFNPADVPTTEEAESFPSRGEVNAVRQENVEMRATVAALREEIDALRGTHTKSDGEASETVSRQEYERVVVEREALKEAQLRQEEEVTRLKTDLAILKRDRLNLQLAYDGAQRELEKLQRKVNGVEDEPALPPVEAAAVVAAQADEVRIEVPKSSAVATVKLAAVMPNPAAPAPVETPAAAETEPAAPLAPAASLPKPYIPPPSALPKAPGTLGPQAKPMAPRSNPLPPKSPSAPAVGSGVRPVARPPIATPAAPAAGDAKPGTPATAATTRLHRPLPPPRQIPQPVAKPNPQAPQGGPKGTQKLSE